MSTAVAKQQIEERAKEKRVRLDGPELARLLAKLRGRLGLKPTDINRALHAPITTNWLEQENAEYRELSLDDFQEVARAYGVPRAALDSLIAHKTTEACLVHAKADFVNGSAMFGDPLDGWESTMHIPAERLGDTEDLSIGLRRFESTEATSAWHSHPGEEIMLCVSGVVEVRFRPSGLSAVLARNDFVHFYAEQEHLSRCLILPKDGPAEVIILRFLQLKRETSSRSEFRELWRQSKANQDPLPPVVARAIEEVVLTTERPKLEVAKGRRGSAEASGVDEPSGAEDGAETAAGASRVDLQIQDRVGLGQFLRLAWEKRLGQSRVKPTLDELQEMAAVQKLPFRRSRLDRLHQGRAPVSVSELPGLAKLYGVEPLLLYQYISPTVRPAMAFHTPEALVREVCDPIKKQYLPDNFFGAENIPPAFREELDWIRVPNQILGIKKDRSRDKSRIKHVGYRVPKTRLANSDTSIALVTLPWQARTPLNSHPGHEVLFPVAGRMEIVINEQRYLLDTALHSFAQFLSKDEHYVQNANEPGEGVAIFLVVRFYG